jgi:ABC-type multidrug transport system ATPase subunit
VFDERRRGYGSNDRSCRRYQAVRDAAALDGLDLEAEHGQVTAVVGPNGAGKTTFVRAVAILHEIDDGSLRVNGHDVTRAVVETLDLSEAADRRALQARMMRKEPRP